MGRWKTVGVSAVVFLLVFTIYYFSKIVRVTEDDRGETLQISVEETFQSSEKIPHFLGEPHHFFVEDEIERVGSKNHCALPSESYKAWTTGIVTVLGSPIMKNCSQIIAGNKSESNRTEKNFQTWMKEYAHPIYSNKAYQSLLQESHDCLKLKWALNNNLYNTKLERDYPIAYVFIVYESPLQFLRLFKILYKPQNSYCIHVDIKSPYKEFYNNIIKCFNNVIAPSEVFNVQWGKYTMLEAQVQCFADLVELRERQPEKEKWNYAVNLCGKELPLHTTKEMVQMIQSMKGTSSVVAWPIPKSESQTIKRLKWQTLPYGLKLYKSMAYNALSADFVTFMVKDQRAQKLHQFFKGTIVPEEHFYSVLFHMPDTPGGYNPDIPKEGYFEVGHYFWRSNSAEIAPPCFGITVHMICVVNHSDLPRIMRETKNGATALFQNKYFMEKNHVVMDCMEEMIVAKNKLEYEEDCQ